MSLPKVFNAIALTPSAPTDIVGPLTTGAMFNLRLTNRGGVDAIVWVSISVASATLENAGYIAYNETIPVNGSLELTGLAMGTSHYCVVACSAASQVAAVAYGVEL